MLIPTSFVNLPSVDGCHNGQVVMGGTMAQMANGLAQLTHCKFLGEAHYQVSHSTYGGWSGIYSTGSRLHNYGVIRSAYKGYDYNFLYQSTPLSKQLAILISYAGKTGATDPDIQCVLRDTASNSYTGTILDHGIKFTDLATQGYSYAPDEFVFSGAHFIGTPTNSSPTELVRPLHVPTSNRGQLLNIQVTVNDVSISGVHIYDVYQVEVTP